MSIRPKLLTRQSCTCTTRPSEIYARTHDNMHLLVPCRRQLMRDLPLFVSLLRQEPNYCSYGVGWLKHECNAMQGTQYGSRSASAGQPLFVHIY